MPKINHILQDLMGFDAELRKIRDWVIGFIAWGGSERRPLRGACVRQSLDAHRVAGLNDNDRPLTTWELAPYDVLWCGSHHEVRVPNVVVVF
jgi:hypothetical protein